MSKFNPDAEIKAEVAHDLVRSIRPWASGDFLAALCSRPETESAGNRSLTLSAHGGPSQYWTHPSWSGFSNHFTENLCCNALPNSIMLLAAGYDQQCNWGPSMIIVVLLEEYKTVCMQIYLALHSYLWNTTSSFIRFKRYRLLKLTLK